MSRVKSRVAVATLALLSTVAYGQLSMDIEQSGQTFTVLPQRPGLNMADLILVDLDNDGRDDLFVGGDASYGGDNRASFFLLFADRIRPENSPFDLSSQQADWRYDAAAVGDFDDCSRLAKGDWNGDNRADLAVAGRRAGSRRGEVYVFFWKRYADDKHHGNFRSRHGECVVVWKRRRRARRRDEDGRRQRRRNR